MNSVSEFIAFLNDTVERQCISGCKIQTATGEQMHST